MPSNTPELDLTVYSASETSESVLAWRTDIAGTGADSNMMKIDTAYGEAAAAIARIESKPGIVQVNATGDGSTYTATVTGFVYQGGQSIILSVDTTSLNTPTLAINGTAPRYIMKVDDAGTKINIEAGELGKNKKYLFTDVGGDWVIVGANSDAKVATFTIGDGVSTFFPINHGFDTDLINMKVRTSATPKTYVLPEWQITNSNTAAVIFDIAPAMNEYEVVITVY